MQSLNPVALVGLDAHSEGISFEASYYEVRNTCTSFCMYKSKRLRTSTVEVVDEPPECQV